MKRPSFQFYPSDWLRDTALRTCSVGARGLWMDMICYMHEGTPYGHLKVGEKVILASNLAVMVGATLSEVEGWLDELRTARVFDTTEDGTIYSRRMIRDETIRNLRAEGGKKGGNPSLVGKKVNLKDNLKVENEDNRNPTPSSSSSSSSSIGEAASQPTPPTKRITLATYLANCKASGKKPIPDDHFIRQYAKDAGIADDMLQVNWEAFKARYVGDKKLYSDWPRVFATSVKERWFKLWYPGDDGMAAWTSTGLQEKQVLGKRLNGSN